MISVYRIGGAFLGAFVTRFFAGGIWPFIGAVVGSEALHHSVGCIKYLKASPQGVLKFYCRINLDKWSLSEIEYIRQRLSRGGLLTICNDQYHYCAVDKAMWQRLSLDEQTTFCRICNLACTKINDGDFMGHFTVFADSAEGLHPIDREELAYYVSSRGILSEEELALHDRFSEDFEVEGSHLPELEVDVAEFYKNRPKDSEELLTRAEQGDTDAQCEIGWLYANEEYMPQSYTEASKWYMLAAEKGHARAQAHLGNAFKYGKGVPEDILKAYAWLSLSSKAGNQVAALIRAECVEEMSPVQLGEAQRLTKEYEQKFSKKFEPPINVDGVTVSDAEEQWEIGQQYHYAKGSYGGNPLTAKWYRLAADQGYAKAQFSLGCCYLCGNCGLLQDNSEAVKWIRLAADQGHPDAQSIMGNCFRDGCGVPQSFSEAEKWYLQSAERGEFADQVKLGELYLSAKYGLENYPQAYAWLSIALDSKDEGKVKIASRLLSQCRERMTPDQISQGDQLANQYIESFGFEKQRPCTHN